MNGIIGITEITLISELNSEQRECLELVKEASDSLLSIINDILDYSKLEAEKLPAEEKPFNIIDIVNGIISLFKVNTKSKGLIISAKINDDVPKIIVGDPIRITRFLSNLVVNV